MTECGLETSVPDWVIDHPETTTVFDKLGIDCSCEGRSLLYACQQEGLDPNVVLSQLRTVITNGDGDSV